MAGGDSFNMAEEFSGVDFNEERLEKRFRKTMETLAKDPQKSIFSSCATRAESKAIYNLLGNEKFDKGEIINNPASSGVCCSPVEVALRGAYPFFAPRGRGMHPFGTNKSAPGSNNQAYVRSARYFSGAGHDVR